MMRAGYITGWVAIASTGNIAIMLATVGFDDPQVWAWSKTAMLVWMHFMLGWLYGAARRADRAAKLAGAATIAASPRRMVRQDLH